jgi:hypothetical protein
LPEIYRLPFWLGSSPEIRKLDYRSHTYFPFFSWAAFVPKKQQPPIRVFLSASRRA